MRKGKKPGNLQPAARANRPYIDSETAPLTILRKRLETVKPFRMASSLNLVFSSGVTVVMRVSDLRSSGDKGVGPGFGQTLLAEASGSDLGVRFRTES